MIAFQQRITNQHNTKSVSVKQYAYLENKNYPIRQNMEDGSFHQSAHFAIDNFMNDGSGLFAVFDGHGGSQVVQYCVKVTPNVFKKQYTNWKSKMVQYFQYVFKKVDDQLKMVGASQNGSTCCLVYVAPSNQKLIYVANLGDTRAVLCQNGVSRRVSIDHKVSNENEQQRIKKMGGVIMRGRVSGQLAITRALGDLDLKSEGIINVPDVQVIQINNKTQLLIIATDGLWDVIEDQKAVKLVKQCANTKQMVKILVNYALKNGSRDNISVLILKF